MSVILNSQYLKELNEKINLNKMGDNSFEVKFNNKQITFQIAPQNNKLASGAYAFGIKQKTLNNTPSLGLLLDSSFENDITHLEYVRDIIENKLLKATGSVQKVAPLLSRSYLKDKNGEFVLDENNNKIVDESKAILNMRLKFSKHRGCLSIFKNINGTIESPIIELDYGFKGVYFIDVGNVNKGKNGLWYVNLLLNTCVVYTQPQTDFRNEYL